MIPLTPQQHIQKIGAWRYTQAYAWARFAVRQDQHLVGLNKIRTAIAKEAALRATGYPFRPFILRGCGRVDEDIQRIAEQALDRATACAVEHRAA